MKINVKNKNRIVSSDSHNVFWILSHDISVINRLLFKDHNQDVLYNSIFVRQNLLNICLKST